ncbi:MAG: SurA N-terminal domain-containing protein [Desulfovibrio sp.]|uniref:SurA N-terminal domain-containing protein n=1 Tax=Desulfovibrio sp. 7SRBS1 TaxID=3378064 RepID=UPI003B3DC21B
MIGNILRDFGKKNRTVSLVVLFTLSSIIAPLSTVPAQTVDRIVAVINGNKIITQYDLNQKMQPLLARYEGQELTVAQKKQLLDTKKQLLDSMVNDYLLTSEAKALGLSVTQSELENQINQIKNSNGITEEILEEQLRLQKMTRAQYEENLKDSILRHRLLSLMVGRKVVVTDQEIQDYYKAHTKDYAQDKQVHLELLLLPLSVDAMAVRKELIDGKLTFEQAIKKYATKQTAAMCGDMGKLDWNELSPDWKAPLEDLKAGDVSVPFPLSGQNALLKLISATSSEVKPLSEVHDAIYESISKPKFEKLYDDYLAKLRNKAIIDIKL